MKPKFRAYSETNKDMVSWGNLLNLNVSNIFRNPEMCGMVLMQSTGLHDKYGVEIFEGDILEGFDGVEYFFSVVEWNDKEAKYMREDDIELWENVEELAVTGNKFSNPELLEDVE